MRTGYVSVKNGNKQTVAQVDLSGGKPAFLTQSYLRLSLIFCLKDFQA
jgi:hypothetical protein